MHSLQGSALHLVLQQALCDLGTSCQAFPPKTTHFIGTSSGRRRCREGSFEVVGLGHQCGLGPSSRAQRWEQPLSTIHTHREAAQCFCPCAAPVTRGTRVCGAPSSPSPDPHTAEPSWAPVTEPTSKTQGNLGDARMTHTRAAAPPGVFQLPEACSALAPVGWHRRGTFRGLSPQAPG